MATISGQATWTASTALSFTGKANKVKSIGKFSPNAAVSFFSSGSGGGVSASPEPGVSAIPPGLEMSHGESSHAGMSGSIYRP